MDQCSRVETDGSITELLFWSNQPQQPQPQQPQPQTSTTQEWGVAETKLLLDKYETYLNQVGPLKQFKTKKNMWQKISKDIKDILNINKTEIQCENRYKTILKRKKKATDNNHTSGSSRQVIEFEEELSKIAAIDDSLEPEVMRGTEKVLKKRAASSSLGEINNENTDSSTNSTPKKRRVKSVSETLESINKLKEENKERRHREKIEAMKDLMNLLKK